MSFKEEDVRYVYTHEKESIRFRWMIDKFGFGETHFYYKDSVLKCDNGTLDKESIKKILCAFVDKAEFTE